MGDSKLCPVCEEPLIQTDEGYICAECDYTEDISNGTDKAGKAKVEGKHKKDKQPPKENKSAKKRVGDTDGNKVGEKSRRENNLSARKVDLNHINPGMRHLPEVTVFGFAIGYNRIRYGISKPAHYNTLYEKKMSGAEAFKLLTQIKRKNRKGRIETATLIEN